jgi:diguanylate cyclase (GGDEF)-like protein/PAS domain S-box-containing protein
MVIDLEGNIIDVNQTGLDFYGWTLDEIKTMNIKEINTLSSKEIQEKINLCINKQQNFFSFKHRIASGKTIDVEVYSGPIKIKNNNYILSTVIDVTDKMKYQEILIKEKNNYQYISYHDHLTGLYNRLYFEDAVHRLSTERQLPLSVIYADLNNLKEVNDQFSHLVGDHLIKEVANILKKSVRSEDIVSRWGGDEFVILLPNTPNDRVKLAVKRIENLCKKSNFEQFSPSLAIGYDTKIEITDNPFDILENAEQKMYLNKNE